MSSMHPRNFEVLRSQSGHTVSHQVQLTWPMRPARRTSRQGDLVSSFQTELLATIKKPQYAGQWYEYQSRVSRAYFTTVLVVNTCCPELFRDLTNTGCLLSGTGFRMGLDPRICVAAFPKTVRRPKFQLRSQIGGTFTPGFEHTAPAAPRSNASLSVCLDPNTAR